MIADLTSRDGARWLDEMGIRRRSSLRTVIHTDDTEMAISIAGILKSHARIDQDGLAKRFARRFEREPDRGYGSMTRIQ